jgi:formyltetrahydrofolate synthetase
MATKTALKLADYVVTEGGFGADLGAEKFVNIKCRKAGLKPDAAVIVATVRAIKYHGGVEVPDLARENLKALQAGIANLDRHIDNVRDVFGLPCIVAINHRAEDNESELRWLVERTTHHGVKVIVATVRAIKYHGGVEVPDLARENLKALQAGIANLDRHIDNVRDVFGLPCIVAINHRAEDNESELRWLVERTTHHGVKVIVAKHYAEGGKGAVEVAKEVVELCGHANYFKFVYDEKDTLWDKMKTVATKIYGASEITADSKVRGQIKQLQDSGYGHYPICVAKTQFSFSTDPKLRGAPHGHVVNIREVRLAAGAEFIVMICGDIMTMPGLPVTPAANSIDVTDDGKITGLF